jgi:DNA modification methylase
MQVNLLHGDCLELMKNIPDNSIDLCLTDPPYGTTNCTWDNVIPFEPMWKELKRIVKDNGAICLFGSEPFSSHLRLSNLKMFKYDLIWQKEKPTNFFQLKRRFGKVTELLSVFYSKQCCYNPQKYKVEHRIKTSPKGSHNSIITGKNKKVLPYKDDGTRYPIDILKFRRISLGKTLHPTQKPVALLEYLIKTYTLEGETVLDFTMGSGSTGVAAKNLNRNFIGIEKDDKYFNIAKERLSASKPT